MMDDAQRAARLARMRGSKGSRRSVGPLEPRRRPSLEPRRRPSLASSEASFSGAAPPPSIIASDRRMSDSSNLTDAWKLPAQSAIPAEDPTNAAGANVVRDTGSTRGEEDSLAAMISQRFSPEAVPSQPAQEPALRPARHLAQEPTPRDLQLTPAMPAPIPVALEFRPSAAEPRRGSVQDLLAPPPSPLVTTSSMVTELAKLHKLSREGSITDEEMAKARQQLLRSRSTVAASPRAQSSGLRAAVPLATSSQPAGAFYSATLGAKLGKVSVAETLLSKLHRDAEHNPTQMLLRKLDDDMRSGYTARSPSQRVDTGSYGSALEVSLAPTATPRPTANTWHGTAHLKQATSSAPVVGTTGIGFGFGQPSPRGEDDEATKLLRRLEGDIMTIGATRSSHRVRAHLRLFVSCAALAADRALLFLAAVVGR